MLNDVEHRHAALAGERQQLLGLEDCVVDAIERQVALGVFQLGVDDHERGFVERARMERRAGDLEQRFRAEVILLLSLNKLATT